MNPGSEEHRVQRKHPQFLWEDEHMVLEPGFSRRKIAEFEGGVVEPQGLRILSLEPHSFWHDVEDNPPTSY